MSVCLSVCGDRVCNDLDSKSNLQGIGHRAHMPKFPSHTFVTPYCQLPARSKGAGRRKVLFCCFWGVLQESPCLSMRTCNQEIAPRNQRSLNKLAFILHSLDLTGRTILQFRVQEPKAPVTYCDHALSVVRPSVLRRL